MSEKDFTELVDLAQERTGGAVLYANDDFFAAKDNLLKPQKPIFIEGKYTDRGKWMDGWESRRRRTPGHDFAIVRLGLPGRVHGVIIDTSFFKGNFPAACSIEGASIAGYPSPDELLADSIAWTEIFRETKLQGDSQNRFAIASRDRFTHLRLHIYPDGGVARLRVFGEVSPSPSWMGRPGSTVDLAAVEHGGKVVSCNDMFFGSRHNLVMPGRGVNMGDGWETKRSRREGPDWVIVELAALGVIERVVVDTSHFKGNAPESCALCVADLRGISLENAPSTLPESAWAPVIDRTRLQAHTHHVFDDAVRVHAAATHARFRIWPDGGVSRLRLFGVVSPEGRERAGLSFVHSLARVDAEARFLACCGARAWAKAMADARPFADMNAMRESAAKIWDALSPAEWDEAFRAHPRIGEKKAAATASTQARAWSSAEQADATTSSRATLDALASANAKYEEKFGRIYIVCATKKTAEEMLALCEKRLENDAAAELRVACGEQRKITDLRLEKLVRG